MADTYLFGFKGIVDTLIWQDFAETHPNNGSFPHPTGKSPVPTVVQGAR